MTLAMQDVLVTIVAAGAAFQLVSRVVALVRPARTQARCTSCSHCAPAAGSPRDQVHALRFLPRP